ncbi:hypothetical protein FOA43_002621 [Brettanomyces nanus]|uniref:Uncharacterized protein n=1 Tax=Eeniella nana TaxID=13502 RepID=A0A875RPN1_EENNA|nr:uncharacterized protein FOA43_002621 [Brettanomyces nanus]QPG75270.1 hypothetical protein FOA43_002621 [Brettanomyces nanus]
MQDNRNKVKLPSFSSITSGIRLPPSLSQSSQYPTGYYDATIITRNGIQQTQTQSNYPFKPLTRSFTNQSQLQGLNLLNVQSRAPSGAQPTSQSQPSLASEMNFGSHRFIAYKNESTGSYFDNQDIFNEISSSRKESYSKGKLYPEEKSYGVISGPPRTSRFYRFFTGDSRHISGNIKGTLNETIGLTGSPGPIESNGYSETEGKGEYSPLSTNGATPVMANGSKSANVTHHYNPYIYPQNRNRVNPPPDFLNDKRDSESDLKPTNVDSIPILHPTAEQFKDPIKYLESVKDLGTKYGAVKIIPPSHYNQKFAANLESLWFKTRRQLWNSQVNELDSRYQFHMRLEEAMKKGKLSINKLPCIDKRQIDLWRLYNSVQLRGGFQLCCGEKMWAQVGRELGFYGKITSSLSSSIKSAYIRYVLPLGLEDVERDNFKSEDYIRRKSKRRKMEDGFYLPRISGSATAFRRPRNHLIAAGFNPYFDQGTTQKRSITVNDDNTLPCYDFYHWHHSKDIEDTSPLQTRVSSLYNIRQCNEKTKMLKKKTLDVLGVQEGDPRFDDPLFLEQSFWKVLNDPESVLETEAACHISTKIHESGFGSKPHSTSIDTLLSPWNLHNLPVCRNSVLQFLQASADSILTPSLTFGMFYSAQSWTMEDHWLYSADYQHMGDKRLCYFIPSRFQENYECLFSEFVKLKEEDDKDLSECYETFRGLINNPDIFSTTVENRVLTDEHVPRCHVRNSGFDRLMKHTKSMRTNEDILLSPEYLKRHGIDVYGCFQGPGEFVVKFPKCYGSSISLGMSVSESVNFATPEWLSVSEHSLEWLQKQQIIPKFSNFRLLINIAKKCRDRKVLECLKPVLEARVEKELRLRREVREKGGNRLTETITKSEDKFNGPLAVTDADLLDTFPSIIVLTCRKNVDDQFTMSLKHFMEHYDVDKNDSEFKVSLICNVADEFLKSIVKNLKSRMISGEEWLSKYYTAISGYDKPSSKVLRPLVMEGDIIFGDNMIEMHDKMGKKAVKMYQTLRKEIERTDKWAARSSKFLQYKVTSRKRQLREDGIDEDESSEDEQAFDHWNSMEELDSLVHDIPRLSVSAPEMDQLIELAKEIKMFNKRVGCELKSNGTSFTEIKNLHLVGQCFGVKLDSFFLLDRILKRHNWLETVENAMQKPQLYDLRVLMREGEKVAVSEDAERIDLLKDIVKRTGEVELEGRQLIESISASGEQLRRCYEASRRLPIDVEIKKHLLEMVKEYDSVCKWLSPIESGASMKQLCEHLSKSSKYIELEPLTGKIREEVLIPLETFYKRIECDIPSLPRSEALLEEHLQKSISINKEVFNEPRENHNYCVCRRRHEDEAMIECDKCNEWFHFSCIGLKPDADIEKIGYLCPICDFDNHLDTTKYHSYEMSKKPEIEQLQILAEWARQHLKVTTPVVESIVELYQGAQNFRETVLKDLEYNEEGKLVEKDIEKVRFVLRKLGGCSVNFSKDRKEMKEYLARIVQ